MSKSLSVECSNNAASSLFVLPSCLRSRPESTRRNRSFKVSFPEEECNLITGYLEPANPWEYADNVSREELITSYKTSCTKHGTHPLPSVVEQLQIVDIDANRSDSLNLKGAPLAGLACESLEEILKRIQFKNINLEGTALDDEGSVALFDMIEYYESATHLNISCNTDIAVRGWQACSRMIKKTRCLEQLEARNVTLNEQFMPILSRALKLRTQLQVLKLENCCLTGRPIIILAAALKLNSGLRELYLADNNLTISDAVQLGAILQSNQMLQLLDVSNNQIQDAGVGHILDGLVEQVPQNTGIDNSGLCILVLWNNQLTRNSAKHLARALARSTSLEMLNVGHNMLTNESLYVMKDSLQQNRTLLRLGMQSTHLSCEGAVALAECIADNPVIQRIDLRDNNIQVAGLMALALSMKVNRSVNQLDLDSVPRKKLETSDLMHEYSKFVAEIRSYCIRNEQMPFNEDESIAPEDNGCRSERCLRVPSSVASRKISLTCETLMRSAVCNAESENSHLHLLEPRRLSGGRLRSPAPSPVPSPVSSPIPSPSRNRFQVSRVSENFLSGSPSSCSSSPFTPPSVSPPPARFFSSPGTSRFHVTLVEPSCTTKPMISSPSGNNITVGFTFKLNDKNINSKTSENGKTLLATEDHSVPISKLTESLANEYKLNCKIVEEVTSKEQLPLISENVGNCLQEDDTVDMEVRQIMNQEGNDILQSQNLSGSYRSQNEELKSKLNTSIDTSQNNSSTSTSPESQERPSFSDSHLMLSESSSLQTLNIASGVTDKSSNETVKKSFESSESSEPARKESLLLGSANTRENLVICNNSHHNRKISWVAPVEPPGTDHKPPSSLEKLLGLFHHPASFFSKTQPQYKATTAIINQQPVANSNASFLLTAGPLAGAAEEARLCGLNDLSPDPCDEDKTSEENPATDVLNNNRDNDRAVCSTSRMSQIGSASDIKTYSRCTLGEECVRTREDENFNVSRHSSRSDISSGAVDKLWCGTLSSVCGASVVMSWAQSSTSTSEAKCCGSSVVHTDTVCHECPDRNDFEDVPGRVLSGVGKDNSSAGKIYTTVMKPPNGMSVPVGSPSLWSSNEASGENLPSSVLSVASVRLVGGGESSPDEEQSVRQTNQIHTSVVSDHPHSDLRAEGHEDEAVTPADP